MPISPSEYSIYEADRTCLKFRSLNELERRKSKECYTQHPEESEILACGDATIIILHAFNFFIIYVNIFGYF